MLIFDENMSTVVLGNWIATLPTLNEQPQDAYITEYFYVLDMEIEDFTLTPLVCVDEIDCATLTVDVLGFQFDIPADWHVLVYDRETAFLDTPNLGKDILGKDFTCFVYGPNLVTPIAAPIKAVDYSVNKRNVCPILKKSQMLCYPIAEDRWINITPSDMYNKYLKNKVAGDIIF